MKDFNVKKYNKEVVFMGISLCPAEFSANIKGTETLDELIKFTARKIPFIGRNNSEIPAFEIDYTKIPYNNEAIDEELGVGGFVLLNEVPVVGGRSIKEAVYGIKRDGNTLKGRLFEYDTTGPDDKYFRHLVDGVENGNLVGRVKYQNSEREFAYNLRSL